MPEIQTFTTIRGRPGIIYEGFRYRRDRELGSGRVTWRCLSKSCSTTIRTNLEVDKVVGIHGKHSHAVPLLENVILTSPKEMESQKSPCCEPNNSRNSDSFLTSTPLPPSGSALERENIILRERISVLEEQWSAAVDRSIMLDKRLLEITENRVDAAVQTVRNHSTLAPNVHYEDIKRFLENKWLTDTEIDNVLNYLSQSYLNFHALNPSVVSLILNDKSVDLSFLKSHIYEKKIIAFVVNDSDPANNVEGSHWSLLIYDSIDGKFYNFDSMQGYNINPTKLLVSRLESIFDVNGFYNIPCFQQSNNYDCGVHVLANLELFLKYRNKWEVVTVTKFDFLNTGFDSVSFRWRLFRIIRDATDPVLVYIPENFSPEKFT
jgi:hypothetical protein